MEKSLGQQRVRLDFNAAGSDVVTDIKLRSAYLIDICEEMRLDRKTGITVSVEKLRIISLAMTAYEEAAMWAVKAATM